jgi:Na+-transporting methylmalonyl-CoA/oxaloacetate decarboxylase beta subunit
VFTAKLNKTSNQDRIASDAWADHLCWIATHSEKGVFFLMFDPQTAIVVSIFLGAFIGIAKFLRDPVMLLGGLAAFGIYYFLFLHNTLLGILKLIAPGR